MYSYVETNCRIGVVDAYTNRTHNMRCVVYLCRSRYYLKVHRLTRLLHLRYLTPNLNLRLPPPYHLTPHNFHNVTKPLHQSASPARRDPSLNPPRGLCRKLPLKQRPQNAVQRTTPARSHPPNHPARQHNHPPTHLLPSLTTLSHTILARPLAHPKPPTPIPNPRPDHARTHRPMDALLHTLYPLFRTHIYLFSHKIRNVIGCAYVRAAAARDAKAR
jgi:hypothetical protein